MCDRMKSVILDLSPLGSGLKSFGDWSCSVNWSEARFLVPATTIFIPLCCFYSAPIPLKSLPGVSYKFFIGDLKALLLWCVIPGLGESLVDLLLYMIKITRLVP